MRKLISILHVSRDPDCPPRVRRHRQGQGTHPARIGVARAVLPQRLRRDTVGRGEFLRPAVRDWIHRAAEAGPGQLSQHAVMFARPACSQELAAKSGRTAAQIGCRPTARRVSQNDGRSNRRPSWERLEASRNCQNLHSLLHIRGGENKLSR